MPLELRVPLVAPVVEIARLDQVPCPCGRPRLLYLMMHPALEVLLVEAVPMEVAVSRCPPHVHDPLQTWLLLREVRRWHWTSGCQH